MAKAHTSDGKARSNSGAAAAELREFVERIERLEEEKKTVADDIKDVFGEAKGRGYDTKALRVILKDRKADAEERMAFEGIVDTYRAALGMIPHPDDDDDDDGGSAV